MDLRPIIDIVTESGENGYQLAITLTDYVKLEQRKLDVQTLRAAGHEAAADALESAEI